MSFCKVCLGASAVLALTSLSSADFVDVQYLGTQRGRQVNVVSPGINGQLFAGQLLLDLDNGPPGYDGPLTVFCSDLYQTVSGSWLSYEIVPVEFLPTTSPMGMAKAEAIRQLYAYAGGSQLLGSTSDDFAAAFQLAIWEIVTDFDGISGGTSLDFTNGLFQASSLTAQIEADAASLFAAIGYQDISGTQLEGLSNDGAQDYIRYVPAPGAVALLGLAGLVGARRRRA